jgi:hypothetical protein
MPMWKRRSSATSAAAALALPGVASLFLPTQEETLFVRALLLSGAAAWREWHARIGGDLKATFGADTRGIKRG